MKIALDIDDGLFQNAARLPDSSDQLTVVNAALLTGKLSEQQETTAMSHASNSEFAPVGPSQSGRLAILAFGVPSLVIWALAVRYSLPVLLHIVGQTPSGMDSANGGRVLYIVLVGIIALCGATLSAGMLRRAWKGKAPVWSAAITLCAAVLGFLLVGLIGD